jgi:hypothetical protein
MESRITAIESSTAGLQAGYAVLHARAVSSWPFVFLCLLCFFRISAIHPLFVINSKTNVTHAHAQKRAHVHLFTRMYVWRGLPGWCQSSISGSASGSNCCNRFQQFDEGSCWMLWQRDEKWHWDRKLAAVSILEEFLEGPRDHVDAEGTFQSA